MWAERYVAQAWDEHRLAAIAQTTAPTPVAAAPASASEECLAPEVLPAPVPAVPVDALLGRLALPRLGLSATVREGVDDSTLDVAIGHLPGTAAPGSAGNAVLAAHRDGEFRPLRDVRVGDEILFVSPAGETRYRVEWMRVVTPDRVDVARPTSEAALTLVTCYPFAYVGRAPKRFVVRAVRS